MNNCLTCEHWDKGAKDKTNAKIREHGDVVMELTGGFPESGSCAISYAWIDIEIHGDAAVSVEVPGNFGCVHHVDELRHKTVVLNPYAYTITVQYIEKDDGIFKATIAELPDDVTYARSFSEAYTLAIGIIRGTYTLYKESGREFPPPGS